MPLTPEQIKNIQEKLCPTGMDEAVLYFFREVSRLRFENEELKKEIQRLRWSLQEQD